MSAKESYKGHRVGSRAGMIHKLFDEKGQEVAKKKCDSLEISPGCYYGWFKAWRDGDGKSKKSTKRPAKRAKVAQEVNKKKAKANARAKVDDKAKSKDKAKKKSTRAAIVAPAEDAA